MGGRAGGLASKRVAGGGGRAPFPSPKKSPDDPCITEAALGGVAATDGGVLGAQLGVATMGARRWFARSVAS